MEYAPDDPDGLIIFGLLLIVFNHMLVSENVRTDMDVVVLLLECYTSLDPYVHVPGTDSDYVRFRNIARLDL